MLNPRTCTIQGDLSRAVVLRLYHHCVNRSVVESGRVRPSPGSKSSSGLPRFPVGWMWSRSNSRASVLDDARALTILA